MKLARVARGMTQDELGQKIGQGQTMVSHFESGRLKVSVKDAKKICKLLKAPMGELFPELRDDGAQRR